MAFVGGLSLPSTSRDAASRTVGDLPEAVRARYPRVEQGHRLYRDATSPAPAIRDLGDHLSGSGAEPQITGDLVAIARHRGWSNVMLWGAPGARRELWYEARLAGLEVAGYKPTRAETAELQTRRDRIARSERTASRSRAAGLASLRTDRSPEGHKDVPTADRSQPLDRGAGRQSTGELDAANDRAQSRRRRTREDAPASDAPALNQISPGAAVRSVTIGDVPAPMNRRYLVDPEGGPGTGFYVDARTQSAAFRDHGSRLSTERSDPNVIRDLVGIAAHRGWTEIQVRGQSDFRRETWIVARASGLAVRGYRPTDRDLQELARRSQATRDAARNLTPEESRMERTLNTIEAVVRGRVADPSAQARVLADAQARIAKIRGLSTENTRPGRNRELVR